MRGQFIWCYSESEAAERAAATFLQRDGEGVTLVKYLGPRACCASAAPLPAPPGDSSVTLSRCTSIQGLDSPAA